MAQENIIYQAANPIFPPYVHTYQNTPHDGVISPSPVYVFVYVREKSCNSSFSLEIMRECQLYEFSLCSTYVFGIFFLFFFFFKFGFSHFVQLGNTEYPELSFRNGSTFFSFLIYLETKYLTEE